MEISIDEKIKIWESNYPSDSKLNKEEIEAKIVTIEQELESVMLNPRNYEMPSELPVLCAELEDEIEYLKYLKKV